jgi:hypothetical protein
MTRLCDASKAATTIGRGGPGHNGTASTRSARNRATSKSRTAGRYASTCSNNPASSQPRSNRRPGAELRSAGYQAVSDTRTENAEAKQGERSKDQRHCVFNGRLGTPEASGELRKQGRSNADDDSQNQNLDS